MASIGKDFHVNCFRCEVFPFLFFCSFQTSYSNSIFSEHFFSGGGVTHTVARVITPLQAS